MLGKGNTSVYTATLPEKKANSWLLYHDVHAISHDICPRETPCFALRIFAHFHDVLKYMYVQSKWQGDSLRTNEQMLRRVMIFFLWKIIFFENFWKLIFKLSRVRVCAFFKFSRVWRIVSMNLLNRKINRKYRNIYNIYIILPKIFT